MEIIFEWLLVRGWRLALVLILALALHRFGGIVIAKFIRRIITEHENLDEAAEKKREDTLIRIATRTLVVVVWSVAVMMMLQEAGVAIGPILAAAGIAGVAVGFGGQYLIRDIISGLFIILENQYRVGDVICVGSTCGLVEDVSLRLTTLRDLDGVVHHLPHGEIKQVSNLAKDFGRVNLNVGVAYRSDLEQVIQVVNEVGNNLARDPAWRERIVKPPQFLRVDDFADSAIVVKILGEVKPLKQWEVAGELRRRLKVAFDRAGIEIPFPQRVVHRVPS